MKSIPQRTFEFGVMIVRFVQYLPKTPAGYAIAGQLVSSGTSIGANIEEAQDASSDKEFLREVTIALKEARETVYWLRIIKEAELVEFSKVDPVLDEARQLVKILVSSVKRTKSKL